MKPKQILLFSFSLLMVGLLPLKAYADDSKQVIDGNNICPTQIGNSDENNVTCNVNVYITEASQTPIQSNPSSNTFGNQKPTQSKSQFMEDTCNSPDISNEDKYISGCSGY